MIKNPHKGKFIVFEGCDGSGQTTQAGLLAEYLWDSGRPVVLTKEPTPDSEAGKTIRRVLQKAVKMEPVALQLLFCEDRRRHLEDLIVPALKSGKTVVCDRYFFSTVAFGGIDLDMDWLINLNDDFLLPDIVFILDVPAETCTQRMLRRGKELELFETTERLCAVRRNYGWLATSNGFRKITRLLDGVGPAEQIASLIRNQLAGRRILDL